MMTTSQVEAAVATIATTVAPGLPQLQALAKLAKQMTATTPPGDRVTLFQKGQMMSAWDQIEVLAKAKVTSKECPTFAAAVAKVADERRDLYNRYRTEPLPAMPVAKQTTIPASTGNEAYVALRQLADDLVRSGVATAETALRAAMDTPRGRALVAAYNAHWRKTH